MTTLRERFTHLRGRAREGSRQRALFVVPPQNRWSPPVYEVALMFDTWLRRERVREQVELGFVTHEASFVEAAGPRMHEVIEREFAERGIDAHASERLLEARAHEASFADGRVERFDLLVTGPPHRAGARYDGLPADEHGFLHVESDATVVGHPRSTLRATPAISRSRTASSLCCRRMRQPITSRRPSADGSSSARSSPSACRSSRCSTRPPSPSCPSR